MNACTYVSCVSVCVHACTLRMHVCLLSLRGAVCVCVCVCVCVLPLTRSIHPRHDTFFKLAGW